MEQDLLISIAGADRPGITARLMRIIENSGHALCDIGQAVTHGHLSLSFVLKGQGNDEQPILKDLLYEAKSLGVQLEFELLDAEKKKSEAQEKKHYILGCVSPALLSAGFIADIAQYLAQKKINIERIHHKESAHQFKKVDFELQLPAGINLEEVKKNFLSLSDQWQTDIAFQESNQFQRTKRLIIFDMDSTLIEQEVIDEIALLKGEGTAREVAGITHRAMAGEIDFEASLRQRVALLEGLEKEELLTVRNKLTLSPGVKTFVQQAKKYGYKLAVISGGFQIFADMVQEVLGLDYAFANKLAFQGERLTGEVLPPLVTPQQKEFLLRFMAQQEKISCQQVVAIGDGANDIPMLLSAGTGIAYHAKPKVRNSAKQSLHYGDMTAIAHFIGL